MAPWRQPEPTQTVRPGGPEQYPLPPLPQKTCVARSWCRSLTPFTPFTLSCPSLSCSPVHRVCRYVCFQTLAGHTDAVLSVVTDGINVISGSRDGTIKVRFWLSFLSFLLFVLGLLQCVRVALGFI